MAWSKLILNHILSIFFINFYQNKLYKSIHVDRNIHKDTQVHKRSGSWSALKSYNALKLLSDGKHFFSS